MSSRAAWQSLRFRLPVLVSVLVTAVLAISLLMVKRELERTLVRSGIGRARTTADYVASLTGQGASKGLADIRLAGANPAVLRYLSQACCRPGPAAEAARRALAPLTAPNQPAVELWSAAGQLVLQVESVSPSSNRPTIELTPPHSQGFGALHPVGKGIGYELVADVIDTGVDDAGAPAVPAGPRLGSIVIRRMLSSAQTGDTLDQLVGGGAVVKVGNRTGGLWTDFYKNVSQPGLDTTKPGTSEYRRSDGEEVIGSVALIAGTPWAVSVELPRTVILASSRSLLGKLLILSAVLLVVVTAIVALVSTRITTPLQELSNASQAIAAGDLGRRVRADRRDEIGVVGSSFNAMVGQLQDAQRTLEARVEERTRSLQETNQELEAFSYSVSHDLRGPLRHIVGFGALLGRSSTSLSETERHYLSTIVDAANRMGQLIDDLLAFSRVGRAPLVRRPVDLNRVCAEAQAQVYQGNGHVSWRIGALPEVEADAALLHQVFVNLLSNALKYSSTREHASIEVAYTRSEGGEDVISIHDNGVGFDMAYVHKLFGVFQRLHRSEEFEGTGIGLANVRRIIQRHGGRTWAEGAVGQGATFYFSLPKDSEVRSRK